MVDVLERPAWLFLLLMVVSMTVIVAVIVAVIVVVRRSGSRRGEALPRPGAVPPGWYPQVEGTWRYWDGTRWTGDAPPPSGSTPTG